MICIRKPPGMLGTAVIHVRPNVWTPGPVLPSPEIVMVVPTLIYTEPKRQSTFIETIRAPSRPFVSAWYLVGIVDVADKDVWSAAREAVFHATPLAWTSPVGIWVARPYEAVDVFARHLMFRHKEASNSVTPSGLGETSKERGSMDRPWRY